MKQLFSSSETDNVERLIKLLKFFTLLELKQNNLTCYLEHEKEQKEFILTPFTAEINTLNEVKNTLLENDEYEDEINKINNVLNVLNKSGKFEEVTTVTTVKNYLTDYKFNSIPNFNLKTIRDIRDNRIYLLDKKYFDNNQKIAENIQNNLSYTLTFLVNSTEKVYTFMLSNIDNIEEDENDKSVVKIKNKNENDYNFSFIIDYKDKIDTITNNPNDLAEDNMHIIDFILYDIQKEKEKEEHPNDPNYAYMSKYFVKTV